MSRVFGKIPSLNLKPHTPNSDTSTPNTREMSTNQPMNDQIPVGLKDEPGFGLESGPGKGSSPATVTNSRGIVVPARPGLNGGLLATGGNLGMTNPNAGRTPERLRRAATDALEGQIDDISSLLGLIVKRATKELGPDGSLSNATSVLSQVSKLAATLTSIGPGTKVTNVVESPELLEVFSSSLESEGLSPEVQVRILERVKSHLA